MNVKPKTYVIMGLFSPNDELTNLKEDVSAIKKQVAELLAEVQSLRAAGHPADTQPATTATPETSPQTSAPEEKPADAVAEEKPADNASAAEEKPDDTEAVMKSLAEMKGSIDGLAEKIDTAVYQEKLIRDLHDELQKMRAGLITDIKRGYALNIISIYERMAQTSARFNPSDEAFDAEAMKKLVDGGMLYVKDMLEDEYSLTAFAPEPGSPYKPKEHKAIRVIDTTEDEKANTVSECIAEGFRDDDSGRIIRPARIVVYRLKQ